MEQQFLDFAHHFAAHAAALTPLLDRYGYAAVFVTVLVEGFGIPAPAQTLLTVAALMAAQGKLDIVTLIAIAWSATVIGNLIGYAIGRRAGRRLLLTGGVSRRRIHRVEAFVRCYGPAIIVIARFVDGLRQLSSIVAGSMNMPLKSFVLSVLLGATLWAGAIGAGAFYLQRDFHAIAGVFVRFGPYAWLVAIGVLLVLLIYLRRRRQQDQTC